MAVKKPRQLRTGAASSKIPVSVVVVVIHAGWRTPITRRRRTIAIISRLAVGRSRRADGDTEQTDRRSYRERIAGTAATSMAATVKLATAAAGDTTATAATAGLGSAALE